MKTGILLSRFNKTDGGYLFLEKWSKVLFDESILFDLSRCSNRLLVCIDFFYGPIFKVLSRIPFGPFFKWHLGRILVYFLWKDIVIAVEKRFEKLILSSGDDFSYLVGLELKRRQLIQILHFSVLDLPWTYKNTQINNYIIRKLYLKSLKNVDSADCISDEMLDVLHGCTNDLNLFRSTVFLDFDSVLFKGSDFPELYSSSLRIAYAGNIRFFKEILNFVNALQTGMPLAKIQFFTSASISFPNSICKGFESSSAILISELRKFDLGFIPLSFDADDEVLVSTSFPSKAASYLSARLPIIALAPDYSALAKFIKKYPLGIVIGQGDLDVNNIVDSLKDVRRNWDKTIKILNEDNQVLIEQMKYFVR